MRVPARPALRGFATASRARHSSNRPSCSSSLAVTGAATFGCHSSDVGRHAMQAMERRYFPSARRPRATTDYQLLALWLHSRPPATRRHCAAAVARFQRYVGHPLGTVTPDDVCDFADSLVDLAPSARARLVGAIRSFGQFAYRLGFRPSDLAARAGPPAMGPATAPRIGSWPERGPAPRPHRRRRSPPHQAGQRHPPWVARGSHMRHARRLLGGRTAPHRARQTGHRRHRPIWHSMVGRRFPWSRSHAGR
jgi:hypothetical protein